MARGGLCLATLLRRHLLIGLLLWLNFSQTLDTASAYPVFDGQTESVGGQGASTPSATEDCDLSRQLFAPVSLDGFVLIVVRDPAATDNGGDSEEQHSKGHYGHLNGFLITITRHNKIMQIFTTQTSKWHNPPEIVAGSSQSHPLAAMAAAATTRMTQPPPMVPNGKSNNSSSSSGDPSNREISLVKQFLHRRGRKRASTGAAVAWETQAKAKASYVADRLSDLMEQFQDVVGPFMAQKNSNSSSRLNPVNIERLRPANHLPLAQLSTVIQPYRWGTGVILVIDNIQQLPGLAEILTRDTSTIKFVLFPCSKREYDVQLIEATIQTFMQRIWSSHSVYHVFFIAYFVEEQRQELRLFSTTGEALFFNPFIRNSVEEARDEDGLKQWGQLNKIPIKCGLSKSLISNNVLGEIGLFS